MITDRRLSDEDGKRLVLASSSPRRCQLLTQAGFVFDVVEPPIGELQDFASDVPPANRAESNGYFKARSVAMSRSSGIVLGADTIVAFGGEVFGKPKDRADARRILLALAGTTHDVITGVTLYDASDDRRVIRHDLTRVTMKPMSDDILNGYLDGGEWNGKAGAYGIQDKGDVNVENVDGSFTNVVGLPMEIVTKMLFDWGILPAMETQLE